MLNGLPADREYYQEQAGVDSLSEDNCSYEQAAEFIEFLDKQSMGSVSGGCGLTEADYQTWANPGGGMINASRKG